VVIGAVEAVDAERDDGETLVGRPVGVAPTDAWNREDTP